MIPITYRLILATIFIAGCSLIKTDVSDSNTGNIAPIRPIGKNINHYVPSNNSEIKDNEMDKNSIVDSQNNDSAIAFSSLGAASSNMSPDDALSSKHEKSSTKARKGVHEYRKSLNSSDDNSTESVSTETSDLLLTTEKSSSSSSSSQSSSESEENFPASGNKTASSEEDDNNAKEEKDESVYEENKITTTGISSIIVTTVFPPEQINASNLATSPATVRPTPSVHLMSKPSSASMDDEAKGATSSTALVVIIFSVIGLCMLIGLVAYKKINAFWNRRHYARVDYLIDGLYEM